MTTRTPTPLDRLFPLPRPKPVPGCADCVALDRERAAAHAIGNLSRVSDCNVLLRAHSRSEHGTP